MRTPTEALKEIRDRLTYFCLRTDGRYDPPLATELVGIIDETTTDSHAVGNAEAIYAALVKIHDLTNALDEKCGVDPVEIRDIARAALSAPPRQCDVGTPDDQSERFRAFCKKGKLPQFAESAYCAHECCCRDAADCKFAWAQMSYEKGGAE